MFYDFNVGEVRVWRGGVRLKVEEVRWVANWCRESNIQGSCSVNVDGNLSGVECTPRIKFRAPGSRYAFLFPEEGVFVSFKYDGTLEEIMDEVPEAFFLDA